MAFTSSFGAAAPYFGQGIQQAPIVAGGALTPYVEPTYVQAPIVAAPQPVVQYIEPAPVQYIEPAPVVMAPPPPPPAPRVSIVARSRDPRAQAAANEILNRFRGAPLQGHGDEQRLLDTAARTLSRALPNPVVA